MKMEEEFTFIMAKKSRKKNAMADLELLAKTQTIDERVKGWLGPWEAETLWAQKILIWEYPYFSCGLFVLVNVLFWLGSTLNIFQLVGICGLTSIVVNFIYTVYLSFTADDDVLSWTDTRPDLLSVPEISQYIAIHCVDIQQRVDHALALMKVRDIKFFVCSIAFFVTLYIIGIFVSAIFLLYATVMALLLWPAMHYHNIFEKLQKHYEPIRIGMEYSLNIKRQRHRQRREIGNEGAIERDSDSDADLFEFIPPTNTSLLATLVGVGSEQPPTDDDSTGNTPGEFTPRLPSLDDSRDFSDDEFLPEDSSMIVPSMEMPSIEDYVDNSLIDVGIPAQAAKEFEKDLDIANSSDSDGDCSPKVEEPDSLKVQELALSSTHFKDSEEEEDNEDKLAEGLSFADEEAVHDDAAKEPGEENVLGMLGGFLDQGRSTIMATLNSPAVMQTASNVMTGAMTGLSALRESVVGSVGFGPREPQKPQSIPGDLENEGDLNVIESEFDFLDQDDLDLIDTKS